MDKVNDRVNEVEMTWCVGSHYVDHPQCCSSWPFSFLFGRRETSDFANLCSSLHLPFHHRLFHANSFALELRSQISHFSFITDTLNHLLHQFPIAFVAFRWFGNLLPLLITTSTSNLTDTERPTIYLDLRAHHLLCCYPPRYIV